MKNKLLRANALRLIRTLLFRRGLLYVHYGITHRCNLRCGMCTVRQDDSPRGGEELELGEIDTLFDVLRRNGAAYVSIGGGEPTLRKDLPDVISLLTRKKFIVRLLTNGIAWDQPLAKKLSGAGLTEISISLDTLDAAKQDLICGMPGAWRKIQDTLGLIAREFPRNDHSVLINTVVSSANILDLVPLSEFAESHGWRISFVPIESPPPTSEFAVAAKDGAVIERTYEALLRIKRRGKTPILNSSEFLKKSKEYLLKGAADWRCDAGDFYLSIDPKGAVAMCHKHPPFARLPSAAELRRQRASLRASRRRGDDVFSCGGCLRPCWAEISFMAHHFPSLLEMLKFHHQRSSR